MIINKQGYLRLHEPSSLYASSYSHDQLFDIAKNILSDARTTPIYCYSNNDMHGFTIANAKELLSDISSL